MIHYSVSNSLSIRRGKVHWQLQWAADGRKAPFYHSSPHQISEPLPLAYNDGRSPIKPYLYFLDVSEHL